MRPTPKKLSHYFSSEQPDYEAIRRSILSSESAPTPAKHAVRRTGSTQQRTTTQPRRSIFLPILTGVAAIALVLGLFTLISSIIGQEIPVTPSEPSFEHPLSTSVGTTSTTEIASETPGTSPTTPESSTEISTSTSTQASDSETTDMSEEAPPVTTESESTVLETSFSVDTSSTAEPTTVSEEITIPSDQSETDPTEPGSQNVVTESESVMPSPHPSNESQSSMPEQELTFKPIPNTQITANQSLEYFLGVESETLTLDEGEIYIHFPKVILDDENNATTFLLPFLWTPHEGSIKDMHDTLEIILKGDGFYTEPEFYEHYISLTAGANRFSGGAISIKRERLPLGDGSLIQVIVRSKTTGQEESFEWKLQKEFADNVTDYAIHDVDISGYYYPDGRRPSLKIENPKYHYCNEVYYFTTELVIEVPEGADGFQQPSFGVLIDGTLQGDVISLKEGRDLTTPIEPGTKERFILIRESYHGTIYHVEEPLTYTLRFQAEGIEPLDFNVTIHPEDRYLSRMP